MYLDFEHWPMNWKRIFYCLHNSFKISFYILITLLVILCLDNYFQFYVIMRFISCHFQLCIYTFTFILIVCIIMIDLINKNFWLENQLNIFSFSNCINVHGFIIAIIWDPVDIEVQVLGGTHLWSISFATCNCAICNN